MYWINDLFLSTRVDLSFELHKLEKFSSNTGKVHFEVLVHLLRCIRENNILVLKYYSDMKDADLSELLRQANIDTNNQLMTFYYSSWKYFPDTGRSTGAYMIFYQGVPIDNGTRVTGTVDQSST